MPRFVSRVLLPSVAIVSLACAVAAQTPPATPPDPNRAYLKEIGYEKLKARLKVSVPDGTGVWLAHVEPNVGAAGKWQYRPDLKVALLDGERPGFQFSVPGADGGETSGHSTQVASVYYGKDSMATGVTRVELLTPDREFIPLWLGVPRGAVRTDTELPKISSHSYVEEKPMPALVRRLDELIDKTGHVAVVAVGKNGLNDPVASLFGSSYNAIVVGLSNGKAANGAVREGDDVPGRTKPDLVVPVAQTSTATPIVASAAALLVQAAGDDPVAAKPIVLKAVLMAGANKDFPDANLDGGWAHEKQGTKPLHPKFGAGQLDVNASHRILTAGRQKPGVENVRPERDGWAVGTTEAKSRTYLYVFDVPDDTQGTAVAAALTWNRRFVEPDLTPVLANFDLSFGPVDESGSFDRVFQHSAAATDNVNLIHYTQAMPPRRYGLRVRSTGDFQGEYALAWTVTTRPAPGMKREPKKPAKSSGVPAWVYFAIGASVLLLAFLLWRLRFFFQYMAPKKKVRRR